MRGVRGPYVKVPWETRFDAKVGEPDDDGCWPWLGGTANGGYGRFGMAEGDVRYAHRVAYERAEGPIPDGRVIDHLCLNKGCVNPDHMELVSIGENVKRHYRLMTRCKSGRHEFTEDNTIINCGRRRCRACENEWQRSRKVGLK